MSSDDNQPCNEAALQRQFRRDMRSLRSDIGDTNRDGTLSAAEIDAEIKNNPEGPLAKLLYAQAMPDLRRQQIDHGVLVQLAKQYQPEGAAQQAQMNTAVATYQDKLSNDARLAVQEKIDVPHQQASEGTLCTLQQSATMAADRILDPVFARTPDGQEGVEKDLMRGAMMMRALKSVEIGSVQVLYDRLATPEDMAVVKSGIDQRVKQLTAPQEPAEPQVKPIFTRG